jgi:hypothetical protein
VIARELTESLTMTDVARAIETLNDLKAPASNRQSTISAPAIRAGPV